MRQLAAIIAVLAFGTGCYRYVPIDVSAVKPQEDVRVHVTESAAARLVRDFGAYTSRLEGQFAVERGDSVSVSVAVARAYQGVSLEQTRQTLYLARSEVVDVRRRVLSKGRTVAATAAVLTVFAIVVNSVVQEGDPNPNDEPPPPPPPGGGIRARFRIPLR